MIAFISDIYTSYYKIIMVLLTLAGVALLFKKPLYTFYILIFSIPFKNFYIWIGTNIEVWKILSAALLIFYGPALLLKSFNRIKSNKYYHILLLYIFYTLVLTSIVYFAIPGYNEHVVAGGFFKNEGRIIFQIVLFLMTINLTLIPVYLFKNEHDAFKVLRIIVMSVVVLSILGIMQEASIRILSFDPFPIHRPTGEFESGYFNLQGYEAMHRMNSLAGEPKHLAIALVIGIVIILLCRLNGVRIIRHDIPALIAFIISLIATYSTTGFVWLGLSLFMLFFIYGIRLPIKVTALIALIAVTMLVVLYISPGPIAPYIEFTLAKLDLEVQDYAVLSYFSQNSLNAVTGVGLGNIHHFAVGFIPLEFPLFIDTPFKGNSGLVLLLGDVGIVGVLLLALFTVGLIRSNSRLIRMRKTHSYHQVLSHLTLIGFVLFLTRYYELFFAIAGIMLYLNNCYSRRGGILKHEAPIPDITSGSTL